MPRSRNKIESLENELHRSSKEAYTSSSNVSYTDKKRQEEYLRGIDEENAQRSQGDTAFQSQFTEQSDRANNTSQNRSSNESKHGSSSHTHQRSDRSADHTSESMKDEHKYSYDTKDIHEERKAYQRDVTSRQKGESNPTNDSHASSSATDISSSSSLNRADYKTNDLLNIDSIKNSTGMMNSAWRSSKKIIFTTGHLFNNSIVTPNLGEAGNAVGTAVQVSAFAVSSAALLVNTIKSNHAKLELEKLLTREKKSDGLHKIITPSIYTVLQDRKTKLNEILHHYNFPQILATGTAGYKDALRQLNEVRKSIANGTLYGNVAKSIESAYAELAQLLKLEKDINVPKPQMFSRLPFMVSSKITGALEKYGGMTGSGLGYVTQTTQTVMSAIRISKQGAGRVAAVGRTAKAMTLGRLQLRLEAKKKAQVAVMQTAAEQAEKAIAGGMLNATERAAQQSVINHYSKLAEKQAKKEAKIAKRKARNTRRTNRRNRRKEHDIFGVKRLARRGINAAKSKMVGLLEKNKFGRGILTIFGGVKKVLAPLKVLFDVLSKIIIIFGIIFAK